MINVMRANADNIKIFAKVGKDKSLPFGLMQGCDKCVGLLYHVYGGSLNKLRTEKVLKHKTGKSKKLPPTDDYFLQLKLRCTNQLLGVFAACSK